MLENLVDFESLDDIKRFFIFGESISGDRLSLMLSARFPNRFYGFISEQERTDRHSFSAFSFKAWFSILDKLGEGDLVFFCKRNSSAEVAFKQNGVRIAHPSNIVNIFSTYETPTFLHFCRKYLNSKGIALDIGGNMGLTGAMLSKFCEHVHIFEANPEMEKNIIGTNFGNSSISIHMKAVSAVSGFIDIYPVGTNNTSAVAFDKSNPTRVPCVTIDEFCSENDIVPNMIKVDVEGVDGEVILGAKNTILQSKPLIFLEHPLVNAAIYNTDLDAAKESLSFLQTYYQLLAYPTMDQLYPVEALGMDLDLFVEKFKNLPVNVAAIPK